VLTKALLLEFLLQLINIWGRNDEKTKESFWNTFSGLTR